MPDEPIIEELQRTLEEADCLGDEDRAKLTKMLGQFRDLCAAMGRNPAIGPEEAAQIREELRVLWLKMLESSRAVDVAEGVLIGKRADQADARRTMTICKLRLAHATKKALEEGTFTGTWEQREFLVEMIGEVEESRASLLEDLTVEDIRQLEDEGVL